MIWRVVGLGMEDEGYKVAGVGWGRGNQGVGKGV